MKTPKEKATELMNQFLEVKSYNTRPIDLSGSQALKCALICVNEMLIQFNGIPDDVFLFSRKYWMDVKDEINKL